MYATEIQEKLRALGELRETWRAAKQRSDKTKSAECAKTFETLSAELKQLETERDQFATLEATQKHFLDVAPGQPTVRAEGNGRERMSRENLGEALKSVPETTMRGVLLLGSERFGKRHAILDRDRETLALLASIHDEAFTAYLVHGKHAAEKALAGVPDRERHYMWTVENDKGGFLAPPTHSSVVMQDRPGSVVMRRLAKVEPTSGTLFVPVLKSATTQTNMRITDFTGAWVKEGNRQTNEQEIGIENAEIGTYEWQGHWVPITTKLLKNSRADIAGLIMQVIQESGAIDEEIAYLTGDGIGKPMGLTVDSRIVAVNSKAAANLTYRGLRLLHYSLAAQYRNSANYLMNSLTYGDHLLGLESTGGTYVIPPNSQPDTLFGKKVEFSELMPDVAADAHPIIFGDFKLGYTIAEGAALRIVRSDEKFSPSQVGFCPTLEVGGQVVRPKAFVKQKVAA